MRHKSKARGGDGCKNSPLAGLTVCRFHGGNTHREIGKRRVAEAKATTLAAKWGVPVDTTPTEAILSQVRIWAGLELFYRERAESLSDNDRIWGVTRRKTGGDDRGTTYEARPHIWITMHESASINLVKFCAQAINAGIEERKVRLAEQQGALVADVIKRVLGDLDLTPAQAARVGEVVPRHLRLLSGGAA